MTTPILGDLIRELGEGLRQVLPDPRQKAEFALKTAELADRADAREAELMQAQARVNQTEATHASLFVAGWRPAVGWTCAAALAWTWIAAPLLNWLAALAGLRLDPPSLPPEAIYPVLTGMLGLGVMRTVEKTKGVAAPVPPAPRTEAAPRLQAPSSARRRVPLPNWLD